MLLDDVRYHRGGSFDFAHRNHYVEAQWIPENREKGWIEDIAPRIGGSLVREAALVHTVASWRAAARGRHVIRGLDPAELPIGEYRISVLPLDDVLRVASQIPAGSILLVVRVERRGRPYRVTHMGMVVAGKGGQRYVRHASTSSWAVVDERLDRFVARHARQRAWPVLGFSLWAIRANEARAQQLLAFVRSPHARSVSFDSWEPASSALPGWSVCRDWSPELERVPVCEAGGAWSMMSPGP